MRPSELIGPTVSSGPKSRKLRTVTYVRLWQADQTAPAPDRNGFGEHRLETLNFAEQGSD